ncbi:hypothetical protein DL767_002300 [Monosporascus sp. MG133]|nr:hypothetical protein DL767_002300 [Monosporascus sp. MG133]
MGQLRYSSPAGLGTGSVILQILTTLCIGLRFYSRRWKRQGILTSDWLILIAWAFGTSLTVVEIYGVAVKAIGHPLGATIEDPRSIELAYLLIGIATLGLIKLSVCFLYWQLFAKIMFRRFLIVWMVIIAAWATSFVLAGLLECGSHLKALFGQPQEYLDHCGSAIPSGWAMVGSDVATDLITLIIPIPVVLKLQMSTQKKILTLFTFMIGALSVGASVAKAYIYIMATLNPILTGISIWNLIEVQVGIIAACGPTLRAILTHILPTETIASLISISRSGISKGSDNPAFDKVSDSQERLGVRVRNGSKVPSERSGANYYELELRTDPMRPGNEV